MSRKSNYTHGRTRDHCYFCGAFGGIEEHHIIPQRFDGPDEPGNIVGLCERCHKKLERLYDKSFYEFFGIDDEQGKRQTHLPCEHVDCNERPSRILSQGYGKVRYCEEHVNERVEQRFEKASNLKSADGPDRKRYWNE